MLSTCLLGERLVSPQMKVDTACIAACLEVIRHGTVMARDATFVGHKCILYLSSSRSLQRGWRRLREISLGVAEAVDKSAHIRDRVASPSRCRTCPFRDESDKRLPTRASGTVS